MTISFKKCQSCGASNSPDNVYCYHCKASGFDAITEEAVNHPAHYGGADNPYETIKVIEAWGLNFHIGNAAKYLSRAGKKGDAVEDLRKAAWYIEREIARLSK